MPKRFEASEGTSRSSLKTPTRRRRIVGNPELGIPELVTSGLLVTRP
jgi:hypothetical protein